MDLSSLRNKIERQQAKLAVIGLGYVGLPVACEFARAGFDVLGVDILPDRVELINSGISPIEGIEPGLAESLESVVARKEFIATVDYKDLSDRDVILIDVETPVDERNIPQYQALKNALFSLGPVLKEGALVIVESTIAPRTMQDIVLPLLEQTSGKKANVDFFLGNCPERVMPGKLLSNLRHVSRVVGGMTVETSETMIALYKNVVQAALDPADCLTAELVKTTENAYRDVQIAFANEIALICEFLGGDVWKVRELVNKSPGRQMHLPGAGVGGHCIPKDPWLLVYGVNGRGVPLRVIPASRRVNDSMPRHMADLLKRGLQSLGRKMADARILVMGFAYLEDSDDTRNSPSRNLVQYLRDQGAEVVIHDPYIPEYQGKLRLMAKGCDGAIVMVRHQVYYQIDLKELKAALRTPILVDGRKVYDNETATAAGLKYWGIGQGDGEG
jgi:UDP-N-acetyl-D-mannosaminuronic acid dehydrogenase